MVIGTRRSTTLDIKADTKQAAGALNKLQSELRQTQSATSGMSKEFQRGAGAQSQLAKTSRSASSAFGKQVAAVAGGQAVFAAAAGGMRLIGQAASKAVGDFVQLEKAVAEVTTLFDANISDVDNLYNSIYRLGAAYGIEQQEAAKAFYNVISAGAKAGAEANLILDAAAKASIGGVTELNTAADAITSVMNAYGKSATDASQISDVFFATVKAGKTTFGELGSSIGKVASVAANFGVTFEEVGASIATLTAAGLSTSEAVTQLNAILTQFTKPSDRTVKAARAIGVELSAAALETHGFTGLLKQLVEATGGSATKLAELRLEQNALAGVVGIVKGEMESYLDVLEQTNDAYGATAEAASKMTDTISFQLGRLFKGTGASIGRWIRDISEATGATGLIKGWADAIEGALLKNRLFNQELLATDVVGEGLRETFDELEKSLLKFARINSQKIFGFNKFDKGQLSDITANFNGLVETVSRLPDPVKNLEGLIEQLDESLSSLASTNKFTRKELEQLDKIKKDTVKSIREKISAIEAENAAIEEQSRVQTVQSTVFKSILEGVAEVTDEINRRREESNRIQEDGIKAAESLRLAYEPLYRAQQDYAKELERINLAYKTDNISVRQYLDYLGQLNEKFGVSIPFLRDYAKEQEDLGRAGAQAANEIREAYDPLFKAQKDYYAELEKINLAYSTKNISTKEYLETIDRLNQKFTPLLENTEDLGDAVEGTAGAFRDLWYSIQQTEASTVDVLPSLEEVDGWLDTAPKKIEETSSALGEMWNEFNASGGFAAAGLSIVEQTLGAISDRMDEVGAKGKTAFGVLEAGVSGFIQSGGNIFAGLAAAGQEFFTRKVLPKFLDDWLPSWLTEGDRVTVGVSATGASYDALDVRSETAASGLQLIAQARRAGQEGRKIASDMLDNFLAIDKVLTNFFTEQGLEIDFSNIQLRPSDDFLENALSTRVRGRGSDLHAQFGSVAFGQVNQSELSSAADAFVVAWIDAIEEQLPEDLSHIADLGSADEVLAEIGKINDELLAEMEAAQKAVTEAEIAAIRERYGAILETLELEKGLLETQIAAIDTDLDTLAAARSDTEAVELTFKGIQAAPNIADEFANLISDSVRKTYTDATNNLRGIEITEETTLNDLRTLERALLDHRAAVLSLAQAYHEANIEIREVTAGAATRIRESRLSDVELFDKRLGSFAETLEALSSATEADELVRLSQALAGTGVEINQLFASLGSVDNLDVATSKFNELFDTFELVAEGLGLDVADFELPDFTDLESIRDATSEVLAGILEAAGAGAGDTALLEQQKALADAQKLAAEKTTDALDKTSEILANIDTKAQELLTRRESIVSRHEEVVTKIETTTAEMESAIKDLTTAAQTINDAGNTMADAGNNQLSASNNLILTIGPGSGIEELIELLGAYVAEQGEGTSVTLSDNTTTGTGLTVNA